MLPENPTTLLPWIYFVTIRSSPSREQTFYLLKAPTPPINPHFPCLLHWWTNLENRSFSSGKICRVPSASPHVHVHVHLCAGSSFSNNAVCLLFHRSIPSQWMLASALFSAISILELSLLSFALALCPVYWLIPDSTQTHSSVSHFVKNKDSQTTSPSTHILLSYSPICLLSAPFRANPAKGLFTPLPLLPHLPFTQNLVCNLFLLLHRNECCQYCHTPRCWALYTFWTLFV